MGGCAARIRVVDQKSDLTSWSVCERWTIFRTLVPEVFIYSLQRNFATQTAFIIFVIGMKRWERWKPLVETVENLTFMPSAFDRRFWLEDILNSSTSDMIGSVNKL